MRQLSGHFFFLITATLFTGCAAIMTQGAKEKQPIVIAEQGNFFVGSRVVKAAGEYDPNQGLKNDGQTFIVDQMYVQYQIPVNANRPPLVMAYGCGQTGQSYESTPDGREGFRSIFLRRGYPVYIIDVPTRGRSALPSFNGPCCQLGKDQSGPEETIRVGDQFSWTLFRLGPDYEKFSLTASSQRMESVSSRCRAYHG
jgi:hypothetical protein